MKPATYEKLTKNIDRLADIEERLFAFSNAAITLGLGTLPEKLDAQIRALHNTREELRSVTNDLAAEHAKR